MSKTYAIIGTGGVGGFYGAQLARIGRTVRFLFRSDYDHVRKQGLRVNSPLGGFTIDSTKINAFRDVKDMGKCDTILVCLKTTSNHKLSQLLPPLMHDKSTVILVQNGYGLEKNLAKQMADLGKETKTPFTAGKNIAGGLGFIASQKSSPGIITHVDYGKLTVGAHISPPTHTHTQAQADHSTPPHTHSSTAEPMRADHEPAEGIVQEAMRVLAEDLGEAGVEVVIDDDLVRARWHKLVWNISMNGLSVLLDAQTDEIVGNNDSCARVEALMSEVIKAAKSIDNIDMPEGFLQDMIASAKGMASYAPSMKADYDANRPMEIEAIYANVLREAQRAGCRLPEIMRVYEGLCALENKPAEQVE